MNWENRAKKIKEYAPQSQDEMKNKKKILRNVENRTSLVVHWLRIRLPMQGTWVRALVWEDST